MNVIQQCIRTLEPRLKQFFLSLVSGKSKPVNSQIQNHEVLYDICCCAPQILSGILPYVTGELQVVADLLVFLMLLVVSNVPFVSTKLTLVLNVFFCVNVMHCGTHVL